MNLMSNNIILDSIKFNSFIIKYMNEKYNNENLIIIALFKIQVLMITTAKGIPHG